MPGRPVLNKLIADIAAMGGEDALYERIAGGATVGQLGEELGVSRPFLSARLNRTPQMKLAMQAALKERAGSFAEQALEIADNVAADPNEIAKAKTKIEVRKWLAGVHDAEQYGAKGTQVNISVGSLHLDALRQVASAAKAAAETDHPDVIDAEIVPDDDGPPEPSDPADFNADTSPNTGEPG